MKKTKIQIKFTELKKKLKDMAFKSLNHAAAIIRLSARQSIRRSKKASKPGRAPNTRFGQLKRSIYYSVDAQKQSAVIGPTFSGVGKSGSVHEFGKWHRGRHFPKREFMKPALLKNKHRLPEKFNH